MGASPFHPLLYLWLPRSHLGHAHVAVCALICWRARYPRANQCITFCRAHPFVRMTYIWRSAPVGSNGAMGARLIRSTPAPTHWRIPGALQSFLDRIIANALGLSAKLFGVAADHSLRWALARLSALHSCFWQCFASLFL